METGNITDKSAKTAALVVSIHDVSPVTRDIVTKILRRLEEIGVPRCSLLVVPAHHRRPDSDRDKAFVAFLQQCVRAGHEVVLHGYTHSDDRETYSSLRDFWVSRVYTAREGEFFQLDGETARSKLVAGMKMLKRMKTPATGFIAPAWLLSAEAEKVLVELGFDYTVRVGSLKDLRNGKEVLSRSMVYSTRRVWRRFVSLAWNEMLGRQLAGAPLVRMSLHPTDHRYGMVWNHAIRWVGQFLTTHRPMTYGEFLGETRRTKKKTTDVALAGAS